MTDSPTQAPARSHKLPGLIRQQINRQAHQAGLDHERRTRDKLVQQAMQALDDGKPFDTVMQQVNATVDAALYR